MKLSEGLNISVHPNIAGDALKMKRYDQVKKVEFAEWMGLEHIAGDFAMTHYLHSQAMKTSRLLYLNELFDAVAIWSGGTVREIVTALLDMVPRLTEEEAFALASVKYHNLSLDSKVA